MKTQFFVRKVTLFCVQETVELDFDRSVNLIEGPVGTGKSSLIELIKYGLGGDGVLTDAVKRGVTGIQLTLFLSGTQYLFRRQLDARTLEIWRESDEVLLHKCVAGDVSDVILKLVGIPSIEIPRSRKKPRGAKTKLSFFDIYRYLYLEQVEIDRSVVHHLESYYQPKRLAAFELLFGLGSQEITRLEVERGRLLERLSQRRSSALEVQRYLASANKVSEEDLTQRRSQLQGELALAEHRLEDLRMGLSRATDSEKPARDELRSRYRDLRSAEMRLEEASAQIDERQALIAQLTLDEQRLARSATADAALLPIQFQVCPNCLQELSAGRSKENECYVCLQEVSAENVENTIEQERERVHLQLAETRELLEADREEFDRCRKEAESIQSTLQEAETALDSKLDEFISPKLERIQELSQRTADLTAEQRLIDRELEYWLAYKALTRQITEAESGLRETESELAIAKAAQEGARERIAELSEIFRDILVDFKLPWYRIARIDQHSYLPVVNEHPFEELTAGAGGMPTMVNDAYHLSALVFSLRHSACLLPRFIIIDSPRKGMGRHPDNEITVQRIYRYFRTLASTYEANFQLIVADNDVPEEFKEFVKVSFDYENPLVPGIEHPGGGKVETVGGDGA